MGQACCEPTGLDAKSKIPAMDQLYKDKRLPHPKADDYRSEFEKEFFMIVNLLRENPASFSKYIKEFVANGHAKAHPSVSQVIDKKLKNAPVLQPVDLDKVATNACFVNLSKNSDAKAEDVISGAAEEYKKTSTQQQFEYEASDYFKKQWTGTPLDLVLFMLCQFYGQQENITQN